MSKRYNIKWRKSDEQELKKTIRNFNDNGNSKYIIIEKEEYTFLINDIRKKEKTIKEQNKLIKHLANKKL